MPGSERTRDGARLDGAESPVEVAIRYLTQRRRFEAEVRRHLRGKRVPPAAIDEAVTRLKELQLLGDEETCRAWIRDRLNFAPRGRAQLRVELLRQGVAASLVEGVLDELLPSGADLDTAEEVLRRSRRKFVSLERPVARRRMWSALARRGFDPETAREAIARFFEGEPGGESEGDAFAE